MTPRQFWTLCRVHDWFYTYSDDDEVYRAGRDERAYLDTAASQNPALAEILRRWEEYNYNCGEKPAEPALED